MFGWEFPPFNSGGLGTACYGLTKALSKIGTQVTFVLPRKIESEKPLAPFIKMLFADSGFSDDVDFSKIRALSGYITEEEYSFLRKGGKLLGGIYGNNLIEEVGLYALRGGSIALVEDFDVIHAHDWLSFGAGLEAKRISGKPLIVHIHSTEFDRTGGNGINQQVYKIEKQGMEGADVIITVSQFTKNIVMEHYGIREDKITVVHNGVEPDTTGTSDNKSDTPIYKSLQYFRDNGKKIVLFVGRLTLQKGADYFLQAAKKVLEHDPDVMFIIAGSGDMETQIIRQSAYLGIGDKVLFVGFIRGKELNDLYNAADLYVLPSVSEPFGITPLEALINETPVLISKQSGVSEVISNALTVDFWDTDEMANKIISILSYHALSKQLTEYGKGDALVLTWESAAKKCTELYRDTDMKVNEIKYM